MSKRVLTFLTLAFIFINAKSQPTYLVKQWDHTYGGYENEYLTVVKELHDKGFVLAGYTRSDTGANVSENTRGGTDFWIMKMDSLGNKLWDKRYGGDLTDELFYIINTTDGGFLLGGWTNTDSSYDVTQHTRGFSDAWIVKITSTGIKQWDKRF